MGTVTKTLTLVPSGNTGLTGMSISGSYPVTNAYTDETSTTYARYTINQSTTGSVYFTFDTSELPASATITSVTATARARVSNTTRVSNTKCQLYTGTTAKGSNSTFATTTNPPTAITLTPGTWTRTELNDLRLFVGGTGSSSTSSRYIYFYGASVTITYTVATYDVTITGDTTPTGTQTVLGGSDLSIMYVGSSKPTVTDNNVDVTSQVTESSSGSKVYVPSGNTTSNFTATDMSNAYTGSDNTGSYASLEINGGTTGTCYLDIPVSLPSGATVQSVSCSVALQFNRNSSSSGFTSSVQMYTGTTAKGSATQWVSSATDVARTVYNLTIGSWTASELANARLYLTATNNASSTHRFIYVYGVSLTVTYSVSGKIYTYTLSNIMADHVIVFTAGTHTELYVKRNGSWMQVQAAYRKVSGSWQQVELDQVFEQDVNYVVG